MGKKFQNLLKKYSICEVLLFHMRGDLCGKNFGLQQKYSKIEDYSKIGDSKIGVLLYIKIEILREGFCLLYPSVEPPPLELFQKLFMVYE